VDAAFLSLFGRQRGPPSHALAYNLGNVLRTLATPNPIKDWSLTSLKEKRNVGQRPMTSIPVMIAFI
jgi:hypothetical protein